MEIILVFLLTLISVSFARIFARSFAQEFLKEVRQDIRVRLERFGLSREQRDQFNLMSSVVSIVDESSRPIGTGFLIAPRKILTAAHILQSRDSETSIYRIRYAINGEVDDAVIRLVDRGKDVAILQTQGQSPQEAIAAPISLEAKLGDKQFYTFGYPHNLADGMWSNGNIKVEESAINGKSGLSEEPVLLLSGEIEPGMSGSPVMDSVSGKVVGIVAKHLPQVERKQGWTATAIPMGELQNLIF